MESVSPDELMHASLSSKVIFLSYRCLFLIAGWRMYRVGCICILYRMIYSFCSVHTRRECTDYGLVAAIPAIVRLTVPS